MIRFSSKGGSVVALSLSGGHVDACWRDAQLRRDRVEVEPVGLTWKAALTIEALWQQRAR